MMDCGVEPQSCHDLQERIDAGTGHALHTYYTPVRLQQQHWEKLSQREEAASLSPGETGALRVCGGGTILTTQFPLGYSCREPQRKLAYSRQHWMMVTVTLKEDSSGLQEQEHPSSPRSPRRCAHYQRG